MIFAVFLVSAWKKCTKSVCYNSFRWGEVIHVWCFWLGFLTTSLCRSLLSIAFWWGICAQSQQVNLLPRNAIAPCWCQLLSPPLFYSIHQSHTTVWVMWQENVKGLEGFAHLGCFKKLLCKKGNVLKTYCTALTFAGTASVSVAFWRSVVINSFTVFHRWTQYEIQGHARNRPQVRQGDGYQHFASRVLCVPATVQSKAVEAGILHHKSFSLFTPLSLLCTDCCLPDFRSILMEVCSFFCK